MVRPPAPIIAPTPNSPSPVTSTSSDTQTMVNSLIVDVLQGNTPKTKQDAHKLFDVLSKLFAVWVVQDLPVSEQAAVQFALYAEKGVVGCWSWCCPAKN